MGLVKKSDQFPERPIVILLVGTPFSRKTSLANTAKNPILIDADRGADRSQNRPDTFLFTNGYKDLQTEDEQGLFNDYSTVIIDTAKAFLDDFLVEHVISQNYKLKTNKMQMYGAIGDEFKLFVNKRRSQNMDIIFISHDKTKDDDGMATINPDITGGSKNLVLRIADQVGYVCNESVADGKGNMVPGVTVNFNPSQLAPFCKNVANLPKLVLPHFTDATWKDFMEREIVQPTKTAINKMTDEQREALQFIEEWRASIDMMETEGNEDILDGELKKCLTAINEIPQEHLQKQIRAYFSAHLKKVGWKWDKEAGVFRAIDTEVKTEGGAPMAEVAPVQTVEAEKAADAVKTEAPKIEQAKPESNPQGLVPEQTTPQINKNPHTAEPKPDLFAPKMEDK